VSAERRSSGKTTAGFQTLTATATRSDLLPRHAAFATTPATAPLAARTGVDMTSVFTQTEVEVGEVAASIEAAATATRRLAAASLRIAVVTDSRPRVLLLHESGDLVRGLTYDEFFAALALPADQFDRWVAWNVRASADRRGIRAAPPHYDHASKPSGTAHRATAGRPASCRAGAVSAGGETHLGG
jgi:hypothetical protein